MMTKYKVRPFISELKTNFKKCLNPHRCIAIDESMIKFKGRSTLKQYMPKKPIKRGYKIWALADSEGYLFDFDIYTGKTKDYVEKRLRGKVVLRLVEGLEHKEHCLSFNNYFNTYNLLKELKDKGINACGTVMANRKNLPKLKDDKQLKQGDYDYTPILYTNTMREYFYRIYRLMKAQMTSKISFITFSCYFYNAY